MTSLELEYRNEDPLRSSSNYVYPLLYQSIPEKGLQWRKHWINNRSGYMTRARRGKLPWSLPMRKARFHLISKAARKSWRFDIVWLHIYRAVWMLINKLKLMPGRQFVLSFWQHRFEIQASNIHSVVVV